MEVEKMEFLNDWKVLPLGEVCKTTSGGTPDRKNKSYYEGNIPWVKSGELAKGLILDTEEKISEEAVKNSSAKIFPKGTLLIALYGATIGKLSFLGIDAATNQAVCGIFKSEEIESRFLYYYLFFQKRSLVKQAIGGAQPNISQGILKSLPIPIPPLAEQQRIVAKIEELFSELDAGKQELEKAAQQLKVYRQAVLKWAFEGRLTNEVADGELPDGWRHFPLKNIVTEKDGLRRGPFGSAIKKEFFVPSGYRVYEQGNAINDDVHQGRYFVDEKKFQELINFQVLPGDLIVSCSGTMGRIAVVPNNAQPGIINQALLRVRLNKDLVSTPFFVHQFRTALFQQKIVESSQGTGMQNLVGIKDFKETLMVVPPLEEQHRIVQEIEARLSVCDKIEGTIAESLQQAEALRQSILKKAFEGKII